MIAEVFSPGFKQAPLLHLIMMILFLSQYANSARLPMNTVVHRSYGRPNKTNPRTSSKITFAADNEAKMYINGKKAGAVKHWKQVRVVTVHLSKGDVVSIKAKDKGVWYGAIADVNFRGKHFGTGGGEWKAVKKYKLRGVRNQNAWMLKGFDSCGWSAAQVRPREDEYFAGKAKNFPRNLNAKYVWAKNAGQNDMIFMRLVVGGEQCGSPSTLPPPTTPKDEDGPGFSGQSDDSGIELCPCQISMGPRGRCWQMRLDEDMCYERDCEAKYECVATNNANPTKCMRKIATEKLMPDLQNPGSCVRVSTEPTNFLVPYAE